MIIVQPKWLTQPRSRQASAGPSDMSTPKTTGSGCTDCSSRVSELQDQVEALTRELAESKERQNGMGKEIDALKELFEGIRSAVFTAPSTGPVKLVVSSPQGTSGDIPASHTPPVAPTSSASLPACHDRDLLQPSSTHSRALSTIPEPTSSIPKPHSHSRLRTPIPDHTRSLPTRLGPTRSLVPISH